MTEDKKKRWVIWKYPLKITDLQTVEMPVRGQILSAGNQGGVLTLWALVDTREPLGPRIIEIIGTGNPIETAPRVFIGTVQMPPFVWHVFDRTQRDFSSCSGENNA
jgi:hypothetical protein